MKVQDNVELLAPAGSYEALRAAINAGCDAVYFGVTGFNMRENVAATFTLDDLKEIASICHQKNIKCYLALNTLVYDAGLEDMHKTIDAAKASNVDAIISFDLSAIEYARSVGVEVHISTQHSISNIDAVKFFSHWADRVVLARELTLEQIKQIVNEIKDQDICGPKGRLVEVEVFIHGAMCVSVSGRCGMSLYLYNSSANCGKCAQPCRRAYIVTDKLTGKQLEIDNEYVMSPQDLCTIGMLDEIIDSGVVSLKIEGRGRAPEYVDEVVRCYREAIDSINNGNYTKEKIEDWNERLGTVYNRKMSDGFYRGKAFSYWSGRANSQATQHKELVGTVEHYFPKVSVAEIRVHASDIKSSDACVILGKTTGLMRCGAESMMLENALTEYAKQGDIISIKVPGRVRKNDKFYKFVTE
ncbi:MAG: peptidase U32 family protein [Patescibacteria group bacterium]